MSVHGDIQYEVGLSLPIIESAEELIKALLVQRGFDLTGMVEQSGKGLVRYSFYVQDLAMARQISRRLRGLKMQGVRVYTKTHREKDWATRWKKSWKPFSITKRFYVIPLWQNNKSVPAGKEPIYLETTSAFGTGLHETTRLVAAVIEGFSGKFESFLDVGTGTGILTMIALRCGAKWAEAIDVDSGAVKVALDNLKANALSCKIMTADVSDFHPGRQYELVVANLVSPDLVCLSKKILELVRPGGNLVVSGVSLRNISKVKKAFRGEVVQSRTIRGREWAAIVFRVKSGD